MVKQKRKKQTKQYYSVTVLQYLPTQIYEQAEAENKKHKIIQNATEQKKV